MVYDIRDYFPDIEDLRLTTFTIFKNIGVKFKSFFSATFYLFRSNWGVSTSVLLNVINRAELKNRKFVTSAFEQAK